MSSTASIKGVKFSAMVENGMLKDEPTTFVKGASNVTSLLGAVVVVSAEEFNDGTWISSPVSQAIGIPLRIKKDTTDTCTTYSRAINALFANLDTASPDFGKYTVAPLLGAAIIVREDGKDLPAHVMEIIITFVQRWLCGLLQHVEDKNAFVKKQIGTRIKPHVFRMTWKVLCMEKASESNDKVKQALWMSYNCPDLVGEGDVACAKCGAKEAEDKKLRKCGACQVSWYCGKECQKVHWKIHKTECKIQRALKDLGGL